MPGAVSAAKMSFRFCSLATSTSSVCSSGSAHAIAGQQPAAAAIGSRRLSTKTSRLQLAQHGRHAVVLDDAALVDDRDVAAQALGFLEVMRRQDDRRARGVDARAGTPTSSGGSRCRRRRSARRGSAAAARASARARSSAGASCRPTACARRRRACPTAAAASRYFSSALVAPPRAGCRRSRPG